MDRSWVFFHLFSVFFSTNNSFTCTILQEYHRIPPSLRILPTISESLPSIPSTLRDIESTHHSHPSNNPTRSPKRAVFGCCLQANRSSLSLLHSNNVDKIIHTLTQIQRRRLRQIDCQSDIKTRSVRIRFLRFIHSSQNKQKRSDWDSKPRFQSADS